MTPRMLFGRAAVVEAVTWGLLLGGMVLKYVTETTDLGVRVFGMAHGVAFVGYCLVTVLVAVDQRWSPGRTLLGLAAAVPPFTTVWFDRYAGRRGALGHAWRLQGRGPHRPAERPLAWLLANPVAGSVAGAVAVAGLVGAALVVGPPVG